MWEKIKKFLIGFCAFATPFLTPFNSHNYESSLKQLKQNYINQVNLKETSCGEKNVF